MLFQKQYITRLAPVLTMFLQPGGWFMIENKIKRYSGLKM